MTTSRRKAVSVGRGFAPTYRSTSESVLVHRRARVLNERLVDLPLLTRQTSLDRPWGGGSPFPFRLWGRPRPAGSWWGTLSHFTGGGYAEETHDSAVRSGSDCRTNAAGNRAGAAVAGRRGDGHVRLHTEHAPGRVLSPADPAGQRRA